MKKLIYLVIIFFFNAASANQNQNLLLLYHQGADGLKINGSIEQLKQAVRNGVQIRLYMNLGFVEHAMDAGFISIFNEHVYAQIDEIQAQRPNKNTKKIELRPFSKHIGLYSTKSPYEIKWYAN